MAGRSTALELFNMGTLLDTLSAFNQEDLLCFLYRMETMGSSNNAYLF